MIQYQLFELEFLGAEPTGSHVAIELAADFTIALDGREETQAVQGFYAGGGVYKIRFYPTKVGTYQWQVHSGIPLSGALTGAVTSTAASATGQGLVQAVGTHFEYEDQTIFHPFGTTIYALAHQESALIEQTYATLKASPFNKVRHCVFPKSYDFNHNEPDYFAFEKDEAGNWDVTRPNFAFWDHLESVIFTLGKLGIQSDLILFHPYDRWGFASLSQEENLIYLDYLLRRFSAIPTIWWSLANEYDLCFNKTMADWYEFEDYVAAHDPYHHLLSNHNCFEFYDFSRPQITHCSLQTTQVESATKWLQKWQKPLVYDEVSYEGDLSHAWGNISGFKMAHLFWLACAQGAYVTHGEVFWATDEVLWWSKGGVLKGSSPARIAFLKTIVDSFPGALATWEDEVKVIDDSPFWALAKAIPEAQQESHLVREAKCRVRCGDEIFMEYLAHHCTRFVDWTLPTTKSYRVEMIDMWEMTRTTVMEHVNGKIQIELPGKEGMAILAVAE